MKSNVAIPNKCGFCHKSYVYHQVGATSQLNHHLSRCTQFQNKLAKAKRQLAQGHSTMLQMMVVLLLILLNMTMSTLEN